MHVPVCSSISVLEVTLTLAMEHWVHNRRPRDAMRRASCCQHYAHKVCLLFELSAKGDCYVRFRWYRITLHWRLAVRPLLVSCRWQNERVVEQEEPWWATSGRTRRISPSLGDSLPNRFQPFLFSYLAREQSAKGNTPAHPRTFASKLSRQMFPSRRSLAKPSSSASGSRVCQRCLQPGHPTYECKNGSKPYMSRPTRSQLLSDPKLKRKEEQRRQELGRVPEEVRK